MSSAPQRNNANKTYIAGMQFMVNRIRNACPCILKQSTIDMAGINRILRKLLLKIMKKMESIARVAWLGRILKLMLEKEY